MKMKQTQIKCNNCGSQITIQDGVEKIFCQYCGNQIILEDENKTTTHQIIDENRNITNRYYDEAKIKELENDWFLTPTSPLRNPAGRSCRQDKN